MRVNNFGNYFQNLFTINVIVWELLIEYSTDCTDTFIISKEIFNYYF